MIEGVNGLLLNLWVVAGIATILSALLIALVQPRLLTALSCFNAAAKQNFLWAIAVFPLLMGIFAALLMMTPSLSHALGWSIDHCHFHGDGHGHLCWNHPPVFELLSWKGFFALGLVVKILLFNLGVELGQIIALTVIFILLTGWRKTESFRKFSKAANVLLMIIGFLLLLMQLHGYQHTQYPDDFPLNIDDHHHIHEDMAKEESSLSNYPKRLNLDNDSTNADNESGMHTHDGEEFHIH